MTMEVEQDRERETSSDEDLLRLCQRRYEEFGPKTKTRSPGISGEGEIKGNRMAELALVAGYPSEVV